MKQLALIALIIALAAASSCAQKTAEARVSGWHPTFQDPVSMPPSNTTSPTDGKETTATLYQANRDNAGAKPTEKQHLINLELKDIDIRSAIEALFKNSGKNYAIDSNVLGIVPSVSFKDVEFETALRNLCKTAGLVYRVDNTGGSEVYIISRKPEQPVTPITTNPSTTVEVVEETIEREVVIEKVPLTHMSASEMLAILGGAGREYGGLGIYGGYTGYGGYYGGYRGYGGYSRYGYGGYGGYPSYGGYSGYPGYGGYPSYGGYSGYPSYGGYGGYRSYGSYGGFYGGYGGFGRTW
ncbi:MAG: hypothetical protein ACUVRS_04940 [Armatimonadota bacterium]